MKQINEAISELLLRHNCVIIPSFGGFVANVMTAKVDVTRGIITPPKKALTFNTNLINNDGLLANFIAKNNSISFDEAANQISTEIKGWNTLLQQGNRVEIEKVGFLYLDDEQNLNFEQDRFFNLLMSSFGLGTVQFIAEKEVEEKISTPTIVAQATLLEEEHTEIVLESDENILVEEETVSPKIVSIEVPKKKRNYWKYAAAAIFIPIAFYSVWIPVKTDVLQSGVLLSGDFNPFNKNSEILYTGSTLDLTKEVEDESISLEEQVEALEDNVNLFSYTLGDYKYVHVQLPSSVEDDNLTSTHIEIDNTKATTAKYHLIAGCFGSKANAESLVKSLKEKGYNAFVLDKHKGLHRVSASQFNSKEKATKAKSTLRDSSISTWVLSL